MKPILLVVACIMLLILVLYARKIMQAPEVKQLPTGLTNSRITKDSYNFLPNEARLYDLVY